MPPQKPRGIRLLSRNTVIGFGGVHRFVLAKFHVSRAPGEVSPDRTGGKLEYEFHVSKRVCDEIGFCRVDCVPDDR